MLHLPTLIYLMKARTSSLPMDRLFPLTTKVTRETTKTQSQMNTSLTKKSGNLMKPEMLTLVPRIRSASANKALMSLYKPF